MNQVCFYLIFYCISFSEVCRIFVEHRDIAVLPVLSHPRPCALPHYYWPGSRQEEGELYFCTLKQILDQFCSLKGCVSWSCSTRHYLSNLGITHIDWYFLPCWLEKMLFLWSFFGAKALDEMISSWNERTIIFQPIHLTIDKFGSDNRK